MINQDFDVQNSGVNSVVLPTFRADLGRAFSCGCVAARWMRTMTNCCTSPSLVFLTSCWIKTAGQGKFTKMRRRFLLGLGLATLFHLCKTEKHSTDERQICLSIQLDSGSFHLWQTLCMKGLGKRREAYIL